VANEEQPQMFGDPGILTGPGYDGHAFWDTEGFFLRL
jgi:trehalose/maltose hydrolase-like predicted phosphorylase